MTTIDYDTIEIEDNRLGFSFYCGGCGHYHEVSLDVPTLQVSIHGGTFHDERFEDTVLVEENSYDGD